MPSLNKYWDNYIEDLLIKTAIQIIASYRNNILIFNNISYSKKTIMIIDFW